MTPWQFWPWTTEEIRDLCAARVEIAIQENRAAAAALWAQLLAYYTAKVD